MSFKRVRDNIGLAVKDYFTLVESHLVSYTQGIGGGLHKKPEEMAIKEIKDAIAGQEWKAYEAAHAKPQEPTKVSHWRISFWPSKEVARKPDSPTIGAHREPFKKK